jgi:DNA mismatch endonuclease (patch repair protein)
MATSDSISAPPPARSRNMAAVKRSNTQPEVRLRKVLHARGVRFRTDFPIRVEGRLVRPDLAFTRWRLAVFVDGCFWHSCPTHGTRPATNSAFWTAKLEANLVRDREQDQLLEAAGWSVVRVWEHEPPEDAATRVADALAERGGYR